MSPCEAIEQQMPAFLNHQIPPKEEAAIRRHLSQCPTCASLVSAPRQELAPPMPVMPEAEEPEEQGVEPTASDAGESIPEAVVTRLADLFPMRDFPRIGPLLDEFGPLAMAMAGDANADRILAYQAVYIAMRDSKIMENTPSTLSTLRDTVKQRLEASASGEVRLALGICAYMAHQWKEANGELRAVTLLLRDDYLLSAAHYFSAMVLARLGFYEAAAEANRQGCRIAERYDWLETIAAFEAQRAWLLFQDGYHREALELVEAARPILRDANDHGALGDLNFCAGRISKREGRDAAAIEYLNAAIAEYTKFDKEQPAVGRSHLRLASIKLDMAGHLLEHGYALHRVSIHKLWRQVGEHLQTADEIFERHGQQRGRADVQVVRAALAVDRGDHRNGERCALDAYRQGQKLGDSVVIGRAAVELCRLSWVASEHSSQEEVPGMAAHKALDWADQAVDHAGRTQNRRLTAKAHIWRGLVLSGAFFSNRVAAAECRRKADGLLRPKGAAEDQAESVRRDNVRRGFDLLTARLNELAARPAKTALAADLGEEE